MFCDVQKSGVLIAFPSHPQSLPTSPKDASGFSSRIFVRASLLKKTYELDGFFGALGSFLTFCKGEATGSRLSFVGKGELAVPRGKKRGGGGAGWPRRHRNQ